MVSVCANCLRWLRHIKRGSGKGMSDYGTCWLDGARTEGDEGCGFHSDKVPPRQGEAMPPRQTKNKKLRHRFLSRVKRTGKNRLHWNR
jgi:hypothetical protein